jgi:lipid II:glycine glycyltransferase (peptidoglycan interpeptide bridge formation enzyme)
MWAQAWVGYLGATSRAEAWRAHLEGDGPVVLPAFSTRVLAGLGRRYQLSPAGTYGGPFGERTLPAAAAVEIVSRMRSRWSELQWRWSPFAASGACPDRSFVATDDTTRVLDLEVGEAELRRQWTKGHRAAARQAERSGVEVRVADEERQWLEYDELYRESLARWGPGATSSYRRELFDALREHAGEQARLWVAYVHGEMAAGALCLYARRHVAYWHGAARERLLEHRPVHLLIEVALHDACERGMKWFDFNPSGGHTGVEGFKKGFGAQPVAAPMLRWQSPTLAPLRRLGRGLRRRRPS